MAKPHSQYICQQCGYAQVGWAGKCPECGAWGSLVETVVSTKEAGSGKRETGRKIQGSSTPIALTSIETKNTQRVSTQISELDRVLGGGLVAGQVVLIAGEPGIGKSTLLLQLSNTIARNGNFLYVSGEESTHQIKLRADRLDIKNGNVELLEETDIDDIIDIIEAGSEKLEKQTQESRITFPASNFSGVVVDSIQTMQTGDLSGMAGSVGQVRECAYRLVRVAKSLGVPIFIVGHVTKEGTVGGPSVLKHIVDTVLWFEGDKTLTTRMLRAVKNRFGPTDEVGIFSMEEKGLISLDSPESFFLKLDKKTVPGDAVGSILQGTRPLMVEIQSLVVPTKLPFPRRVAQGIDPKRLELLIAVLTRRCGIPLYEQDVFVNVAGGVNAKDPSSDLAVCMCIASSFYDKSLPSSSIAVGEIGLLGDIRQVVAQEKRVKEAKRLGFKIAITNEKTQFLSQAISQYLK
jgi:DNA repair protein RadA/Sms